MNILITMHEGEYRDIYFPREIIEGFCKLGNVILNNSGKAFTEDDLAREIRDVDVCVSHWWCPTFTDKVLENANRLKLIAHAAGSVASIATDNVYRKGIKVCGSNSIMAKYVAEGTLAYILAGLRQLPKHDRAMKDKKLWEQYDCNSLFGKKVGLIGFGSVGVHLANLLKPFSVQIKVYDPYISKEAFTGHPEISICEMDEVLAWAEVLSIHASQTPETFHILNREKLNLVRDGALLVNTARGSIIDEAELAEQLEKGRFNAVIDVYEEEPLQLESPLRMIDNVILIPHMAGKPSRENLTYGVIEEIGRFIRNEPLQYEISYEKFKLMTR